MHLPPLRLRRARLVASLGLLLPLLGCGKKGPPLAPLRKNPMPVSELKVGQQGDSMVISYVAPTLTVEGERLDSVEVDLQVRAEKDGQGTKGGRRIRLRVAPGERRTEALPLPEPGVKMGVTARVRSKGALSTSSGLVTFTIGHAPTAPASVKAANDPAGVLVEWPTPEPTSAPAPAPSPTAAAGVEDAPAKTPRAPAGYWVRRRPQGGEAKNLTTRPVPAPPYVDDSAEPGRTYCYTVRHVVSLSPLVASPDSPEACLEVKDVRPPDAPRGVTLLPRVDHLEVSWSPSTEADLATYRVYRSRAGETDAVRVAELPPAARSYHDKDVARGASYQYVVTGVDRHGNESARSSPVSGALP